METMPTTTGDLAEEDDSPVIPLEDENGLSAEIVIADRRWLALIDAEFQARAKSALRFCLESTARSEAALTVLLADDAMVAHLNAEHRGKPGPTNVLSFPDDDEDGHIGDIAMAWGVMDREAGEFGISLEDHALHLLIHGALHLLGHDHGADAEADAMESLETAILAHLGVADPYAESREAGE